MTKQTTIVVIGSLMVKILNSGWRINLHLLQTYASLTTFWRSPSHVIMKTYLYNFDPLKSLFYIVKLGFKGYTLFSLFLLKNIDCWYSLELPQWGGSYKYPQSMFSAEIEKISEFLSENFQFLVVKFSIYLNRCVFGGQSRPSLFVQHLIIECRQQTTSPLLVWK